MVKETQRVIARKYRLVEEIGKGGMGVVYKAEHLRGPKLFAVKFIKPEALVSRDVHQRFKREATLVSALGHLNIVQVFDFDVDDADEPYIVMEYVDGETLQERIAGSGGLGVASTLRIAIDIADALHALHEKGIVHRDLKPPNIMLTRYKDRDDFPKIMDFGISKALDSTTDLTKSGMMLGTPNYMSPEQVEGSISDIDGRTDIFSFGAIMYEMLCGRPAFKADTMAGVFHKVCNIHPPDLVSLDHRCPGALSELVRACMSKQKGSRFQSVALLRSRLLQIQKEHLAQQAGHQDESVSGRGAADDIQFMSTLSSSAAEKTEKDATEDDPGPAKRRYLPAAVVATLVCLAVGVVAAMGDWGKEPGGPTARPDGGVTAGRGAEAEPKLPRARVEALVAMMDRFYRNGKCPYGKVITGDTAGTCCWVGQSRVEDRCVGRPMLCPKGTTRSVRLKSCTPPECTDGRVRAADGYHCCWEGQSVDRKKRLCAGVPAECPEGRAVDREKQDCVERVVCWGGKVLVADDKHCCWPGQTWDRHVEQCRGTPARCPEGFMVSPGGDDCVLPPKCRAGMVHTKDRLHCCWPGQAWNTIRKGCVGVPTRCPAGHEVDQTKETCRQR